MDGVNPADIAFVDALGGGVTSVVVKPGSANVVGGRTVALKTWGRTVDDMCFREPASLKSALGENPKRVYGDKKMLPSTRMGVAATVRDALERARYFRAQKEQAAAKGEIGPPPDPTSETLLLALEDGLPWCQHAHRADDIATALRLAAEFGYRLVLNHATEGHLLAAELAAAGVPCVVGPTLVSRSKVELRNRTLRTPALLHAAGVEVALTTDHPVVPIGFLVHEATFAVKEGLPADVALARHHGQPRPVPRPRRPGRLAAGRPRRRRRGLGRRPARRHEPRPDHLRRGPPRLRLRHRPGGGARGRPVAVSGTPCRTARARPARHRGARVAAGARGAARRRGGRRARRAGPGVGEPARARRPALPGWAVLVVVNVLGALAMGLVAGARRPARPPGRDDRGARRVHHLLRLGARRAPPARARAGPRARPARSRSRWPRSRRAWSGLVVGGRRA